MKKMFIATIIALLSQVSCQPVSVREEPSKQLPVFSQGTLGVEPETAEEVNAGNEVEEDQFDFLDPSLRPTTNIHYTGKYCSECHEQTPVEGGNKYLKFGGDYKQVCRCHTGPHESPIHSVDVVPSPEKAEKIPNDFPLDNGKLTCRTCHDIYGQCRKRLFGKNSLRGAPYEKRTDFCYKCHEETKYQKLDPHKQINDAGEVMIQKCLFCHEEKPEAAHATFKDVKLIGDIEVLCQRCHMIAGNHSGNFDHLGIVPSPERLKVMKGMEEKFDIILPLDENGKMTCITCHNPHDKGVIPSDRPGAKGAGSEFRHRLVENLCKECHQM